MSDRRVFRWATTSARLLAGTAVSIVAAIAVVTAISIPWPTVLHEPASVSATAAPTESVVVCDGGLLIVGRNAADAGQVSAATTQSVTSGTGEGAPAPVETRLEVPALAGGPGPAVFTVQPEGRARTDLAASGSATVAAEDIVGFSASACRPPLMESWLVGGSAATGAADLVLLSNPGVVPATVQLTAYVAAGAQTPTGGADIVVAPGTQRIIPLAGLVLGEEAPVIRVSAVGAPVHAALQASITRTLTPGGADQVGPVAAPEADQTIAGVTVTETPADGGAAGAPTVLRVLSPSADASATVTVSAVGAPQAAVPDIVVPLVAGQPTEVALGPLDVGTYTVRVRADQPVVAAVWHTTGFAEGADFAWYTAAPLVSVPSLFAAPSGPPPILTVVNPGDAAATVSIASADGAFRLELTVPAGGSAPARLSPRTVYLLDPGGHDIHAGLSLAGDSALAAFPVWPADAAAQPIVVYP